MRKKSRLENKQRTMRSVERERKGTQDHRKERKRERLEWVVRKKISIR